MFSGLTNQVSTWMGKKAEDGGTELLGEEKITSPIADADVDMEKKDSPTKGSKLEMLAGVKSQMTGWLSGGISGLGRSGPLPAAEGDATATGELAAGGQHVPAAADEPMKDDDASRNVLNSATGGADSGPGSPGGTPTDDPAAQQSFSGVSTKALESAKNISSFLFSAVNMAGRTVVEASAKIKKTVEENKLIAELNKEQESFIASKQTGSGEAVAPWVGAPNEDLLREECLSLSTDRRNFVRAPPQGVDFDWSFEAAQPVAQAILALDPNLETMRFELVPKVISEESFWRNYFYRVSLLRQGHELNVMASQAENNPNQTLTSAGSTHESQVQMTSGQETSGAVTGSSNNTLTDSPGHEFVSDSMRVSDTDLAEVREGMKKLGMQPPKEEDWQHELVSELQDYEVVSTSFENNAMAMIDDISTFDNDAWEKHIEALLASEDAGDLN